MEEALDLSFDRLVMMMMMMMMILTMEDESTRTKTRPSATLSATNPTRTVLGSNNCIPFLDHPKERRELNFAERREWLNVRRGVASACWPLGTGLSG